MKRIAYIELDTHAEIAANFMELMDDSEEFVVDYYFSEKILKSIGKHQSNIFLTESSEVLNQLKSKNYDLVIIGTVHRYFNIFEQICEKFNTAIIAHNLNFTKISKLQLFRNIFKKDFIYRLKLLLKEDLLSATDVFKKAKNLLVLDKSLVQQNFKFLPLFFNKFNEKSASENFTIVIPGAVSQARRDYKRVLEIVNQKVKVERRSREMLVEDAVSEEEVRSTEMLVKNFEIIFLGKAKGKELHWLENYKNSSPENLSIKYFTEKVPQPIFDEWMNKADVLWCPIQQETEFFSNNETYGKTKMSGNIGDAIKYGKFAFFPANYHSDLDFIINENKNRTNEILDFNGENSYNFQENFNKEKIRRELENVLKTLI